jgi:hypothetical protein
VINMADAVDPPGKARIIPCPECQGVLGRSCYECDGQGRLLQRTCPQCGDTAWDYLNGTNESGGMACLINCGYRWSSDHPGWQAQVLRADDQFPCTD